MPLLMPSAVLTFPSLSNTARHIAHWASVDWGSRSITNITMINRFFILLKITFIDKGINTLYFLSSRRFYYVVSLVIGRNHQIDHNPANRYIQPYGKRNFGQFSMCLEFAQMRPGKRFQYQGNHENRKYNMGY